MQKNCNLQKNTCCLFLHSVKVQQRLMSRGKINVQWRANNEQIEKKRAQQIVYTCLAKRCSDHQIDVGLFFWQNFSTKFERLEIQSQMFTWASCVKILVSKVEQNVNDARFGNRSFVEYWFLIIFFIFFFNLSSVSKISANYRMFSIKKKNCVSHLFILLNFLWFFYSILFILISLVDMYFILPFSSVFILMVNYEMS